MLSDAAIAALIATLIIVIMFLLFINATLRNIRRKHAIPVAKIQEADRAEDPENPLVYPFYVDCSLSLKKYGENSLFVQAE